jgi:hypothetical protein
MQIFSSDRDDEGNGRTPRGLPMRLFTDTHVTARRLFQQPVSTSASTSRRSRQRRRRRTS